MHQFIFPVPPSFPADQPRHFYNWEGHTRNITCEAVGEPEPLIRWLKQNELIERNNETFRIYNQGRQGILQVKEKRIIQ